jgi:hypothetical protein
VQTEFISEPHNGEFIYNGNIVGAANGFQREIFHYGSEHGSLEFSTKAVLWHPSGDWVIALSGDSRDDLLGVYVGQTDGSFQRRLSTCLDKAFACYGWLPDTNNRNL